MLVNTQVTQYATTQTIGMISDRISQAMSSFGSNFALASASTTRQDFGALAFGNGGMKFTDAPMDKDAPAERYGFWGDLSQLWLSDSQIGANYSGRILAMVGGVDYKFTDRLLLGLALGHERIHLDTIYNAGFLNSRGYAVTGYGGYVLSRRQSIDFQLGYAAIAYSESHIGAAGNFNGNRVFGAIDWNSRFYRDRWRLVTSLGLFGVSEWQSGYRESNGNAVAASNPYVLQFRLKGTAGYAIPTDWGTFEPFGSARLDFDALKSAPPVINALGQTLDQNNFGITFGIGLKAHLNQSITTSIEYTNTQLRQELKSSGIRGTLRVQF